MVKVIGRVRSASDELAYKVIARGYAFEVAVLGKRFRIKHLANESRVPLNYLSSAFEEVSKFLAARCAQLVLA